MSDRQGRDGGAVGQGRHVIDARTEVKKHEAETFAKEIAERFDSTRVTGNKFQRLALMVSPAFRNVARESKRQGARPGDRRDG